MPLVSRLCCKAILLFCICLTCCLTLTPVAFGKIYRWVDDEGRTHFTDSQQNIPEQLRDKTKEYRPDPSSMSVTESRERTDSINVQQQDKLPGRSISIPYKAREGWANRVIVEVKFNNSVSVPMMLDTGSPGLVISSEVARQLGLLSEDGSQLMVLISGIGGRQKAIRTIIDKLTIGNIDEKFVPAHIVQRMSPAYEGLIGMDILSGYNLTIDSAKHRLIATPIPTAKDLPAGRSQAWWQSNFREFSYYIDFWETQSQLLQNGAPPYDQEGSSAKERLSQLFEQQRAEARRLYQKLDRFSRQNNVPRHWRR